MDVPLKLIITSYFTIPAFSAGPIDRLERFIRNLNQPIVLEQAGWVDAGTRLFWGLFKKFIIADALAGIALNEKFGLDVRSVGWFYLIHINIYMVTTRDPVLPTTCIICASAYLYRCIKIQSTSFGDRRECHNPFHTLPWKPKYRRS